MTPRRITTFKERVEIVKYCTTQSNTKQVRLIPFRIDMESANLVIR
jgi:hypothetical protein